MNIYLCFSILLSCILIFIPNGSCSQCGCKMLRPCYKNMLDTLLDRDEASCIEDASIGASTITIFLNAIKHFCGEFIDVKSDEITYEGRHLYEVVIHNQDGDKDESIKPVIIIEAGQEGRSESVMSALRVVQQLIACGELSDMIKKVQWVILPCTNPDGMEYARHESTFWRKNMRPSEDNLSIGVDITRNFDFQWGSCPKINSGFSQIFPGLAPSSENETIFIRNILSKYKKGTKAYLSIKGNGHSIGYPYAYSKSSTSNSVQLIKIASDIASRVNQRTGGIHLFTNNSIHELEGEAHCGHSVDYAYDQGIALAFEMRVFLRNVNRILTKFHTLPRGYEASLGNGYFSGIKELYNAVTNGRKRGKVQ